VQFAIVETTGSLSVMKKADCDTPERKDMGITSENGDPPQIIAADGRIIPDSLNALGLDRKTITAILSRYRLALEDVLIMTGDGRKNYYISRRTGGEPLILKGEEQ
jgi:uncharacterized membrane protein YcaP (DUF421 family)